MSEEQAGFLQRAVSGAVDATVGRVEGRVVATTQGVIDDLEPYLAAETVPRIVDALTPYLVETVIPEVLDGLTERLAAETGPRLVAGMTPELADELVPVLLQRMRPYLESELVPAVVDGVTPHIIEQTGPRIVEGLMPYIRGQVVPQILDDFVDDPRVRDLIREQSLGLLWDALEALRRGLAKADDVAEGLVRTVTFRGAARDALPPDEMLPGRSRSHAGLVSRAAGTAIDVGLISLVAAQGLATVLALLGSVLDPIPTWVVAALTAGFASLGPLYLAVVWRATGRSVGGAIAGYAVVGAEGGHLGVVRALVRASISLFLMPVWAVGMSGSPFNSRRRSWGDRLLGSRTPYLAHVERRTDREGADRVRSEWR